LSLCATEHEAGGIGMKIKSSVKFIIILYIFHNKTLIIIILNIDDQ
jgi:hypothetical protein